MKRSFRCFWLSRLQCRIEMEKYLLQNSSEKSKFTTATLLHQMKSVALVQGGFQFRLLLAPKRQRPKNHLKLQNMHFLGFWWIPLLAVFLSLENPLSVLIMLFKVKRWIIWIFSFDLTEMAKLTPGPALTRYWATKRHLLLTPLNRAVETLASLKSVFPTSVRQIQQVLLLTLQGPGADSDVDGMLLRNFSIF